MDQISNVISNSKTEEKLSAERKLNIIQVATMDQRYLPSKSVEPDDAKSKRLIFIGDIHGCKEELESLLIKAKYNSKTDHIIATGDIIQKGPHSRDVIDFLRERHASCVRGNQDDAILRLLKKSGKEDSKDAKLAASLNKHQLHYLQSCPLILRVGDIDPHGHIIVVHGGVVPGVKLEDQDPSAVMNMRIINPKTMESSKEHSREGFVNWAKVWNDYQNQLLDVSEQVNVSGNKDERTKPTTVVYGHDAKVGLNIQPWTKGLDSKCVTGGKLTAWVVSGGGHDEIFQVDGNDYTN